MYYNNTIQGYRKDLRQTHHDHRTATVVSGHEWSVHVQFLTPWHDKAFQVRLSMPEHIAS